MALRGLALLCVAAQTQTAAPPTASAVFPFGEGGSIYTWAPALVHVGGPSSKTLLAFAHMEQYASDNVTINVVLCSKRSTNDGSSWSEIAVNFTYPPWPAGIPRSAHPAIMQPTPVWDSQKNVTRLFFQARFTDPKAKPATTLSSQVYSTFSTDLGNSWAPPVGPVFPPKDDAGTKLVWSMGGQQATQLQSGPHAGRILVGGYAGWSDGPGTPGHASDGGEGLLDRGTALFSDDGGVHFTQSKLAAQQAVSQGFADGFAEPVLAELANGTVYLSFRNENCQSAVANWSAAGCFGASGLRTFMISHDGGQSFQGLAISAVNKETPGAVLRDPTGSLGCQASLLGVGGSLYFCNPDDASARISLTVQRARPPSRLPSTVMKSPLTQSCCLRRFDGRRGRVELEAADCPCRHPLRLLIHGNHVRPAHAGCGVGGHATVRPRLAVPRAVGAGARARLPDRVRNFPHPVLMKPCEHNTRCLSTQLRPGR